MAHHPHSRAYLAKRLSQETELRPQIFSASKHEVALLVGEPHRQLPEAQFGLLQRQLDDLVVDVGRDAVPHPARCRGSISQRLGPAIKVTIIPATEGPALDAELIQCFTGGHIASLGPAAAEMADTKCA